MQKQQALQEREKQLLAMAEAEYGGGDEDPEPELEEGEVEETEEEQLAALQLLSQLLREKEMLGRELDERLQQQKADSASLEERMDAMENGDGTGVVVRYAFAFDC